MHTGTDQFRSWIPTIFHQIENFITNFLIYNTLYNSLYLKKYSFKCRYLTFFQNRSFNLKKSFTESYVQKYIVDVRYQQTSQLQQRVISNSKDIIKFLSGKLHYSQMRCSSRPGFKTFKTNITKFNHLK